MSNIQIATLGGGCFWCLEAIFEQVEGVHSVMSGYSGGTKETADYKTVCSGTTRHAEVVQIQFDPAITSYEELLQIYFTTHDPTTPNRQGNDKGPQYRSIVFYHNEDQRIAVERS
ncbi:MAG: peptide-methionine (S)-S-oxide reductase MsrA, partial [Bacteroidota bacterium]